MTTRPSARSYNWSWRLFAALILVVFVVISVNISSKLADFPLTPRPFADWEVYVWEISSALGVIILLYPVFWVSRRWYVFDVPTLRFIGAHLLGAFIFCGLHVDAMIMMRKGAYALQGLRYTFATSPLTQSLTYELRKDMITYATLVAIFSAYLYWRGARAGMQNVEAAVEAPLGDGPTHLELRENGRILRINLKDILYLESERNYVSIVCAYRTYSTRGTLKEFLEKLASRGFSRIHKSRLVNISHVHEVKSLNSGDFILKLEGEDEIGGSRRFKEAFMQAYGNLPAV